MKERQNRFRTGSLKGAARKNRFAKMNQTSHHWPSLLWLPRSHAFSRLYVIHASWIIISFAHSSCLLRSRQRRVSVVGNESKMAALKEEQCYGLSCGRVSNGSNISVYHVKLTDSALRAFEDYQSNKVRRASTATRGWINIANRLTVSSRRQLFPCLTANHPLSWTNFPQSDQELRCSEPIPVICYRCLPY